MDFTGLIDSIRDAERITVFRHTAPDCDACGSQFGLVSWIRDNYPDKDVRAAGDEKCTQGQWPDVEKTDDEFIRTSLAIVCDTANSARIDDSRYVLAEKVIKIDHHPSVEPYGTLNYVFPEAAATCEVLSEFFRTQQGCTVSLKTAEYLYAGLLTDTMCFRTTNTTEHTLLMASYLAGFGVPIPQLNQTLFDQTEDEFSIATKIRSMIQHYSDHLIYVEITEEQQKKWGISASRARSFVSEIGGVVEYEIWIIFTEEINEAGQSIYGASMRAKTVKINDIAAMFNGGGHAQAAGIKGLSKEDRSKLLELLENRLKSQF